MQPPKVPHLVGGGEAANLCLRQRCHPCAHARVGQQHEGQLVDLGGPLGNQPREFSDGHGLIERRGEFLLLRGLEKAGEAGECGADFRSGEILDLRGIPVVRDKKVKR